MAPDWQQLLRRALARNRQRTAQLATVRPEGGPAVRTVILRGVSAAGELYWFSDRRSQKFSELAACPQAALCLWWPKTGEQFRIAGPVACHDGLEGPWGEQRAALWQALDRDNRALFLGPPPGSPYREGAPLAPDGPLPPASFVLLVLAPQAVDYLKLGTPHLRWRFRRQKESWQAERCVP